MIKKTIRDVDIRRKRILLRVAYDIKLQKQKGRMVVSDDARIRATLPTIEYLLEHECSIVALSSLRRPGGKIVEEYRMEPVARALSKLIKRPVKSMQDCIGDEVNRVKQEMKSGELVMLENTRFYPEEEQADPIFSEKLVEYTDIVVFDAFAQAHRAHASTVGILRCKPSVAGFLVEKELSALSSLLDHPVRPFVVVLGGVKISDKMPFIKHILPFVDHILIGGSFANIFLSAQGKDVGSSLIESTALSVEGKKFDSIAFAQELLKMGKSVFIFPSDFLAGNSKAEKIAAQYVDTENGEKILPEMSFLDIGEKTVRRYADILSSAKTIFWNGPLGYFECEQFSEGTRRIAEVIAESQAVSVVGGGDTERIIKMFSMDGKFSHVSTGGGATLQFLAGKSLPAIDLLPDATYTVA